VEAGVRFPTLDLVAQDWLREPMAFAATLSDAMIDDDEPVQTAFFRKARIIWCAHGVERHFDNVVPEWSYLLVLRNDRGASVWDASRRTNAVPVGTLFELPLHIIHALPQRKPGIWAACVHDSKARIDLAVAARAIRERLAGP
jgi:hypothetical protein